MSLRSVLLIVAALGLGLVLFPPAASAMLLNLANASLAQALNLPVDAPTRPNVLAQGTRALAQARRFADLGRLPLAEARLALAGGQYPAALAAFSSARSTDVDPVSEFAWAQAAWQAGQPDSASLHWRNAGAITFFMQQAHRTADAHRWQDAATYAGIAAGIEPSNPDALYVLADANLHIGVSPAQVLTGLDRALELTQDREFRSMILSRKAEILAGEGQWAEALVVFEQAIETAPIDARPRTGYALARLRLDPTSRDAGVAVLRQVVKDSPWYIDAYLALASLAESSGDLAGGEAWLIQGLEHNPDDSRLLFPLGEYYARQNHREAARRTLNLALEHTIRVDERQAISEALARLGVP